MKNNVSRMVKGLPFLALMLSAASVTAQSVTATCSNPGPGARFGVTSYTCVSCRINQSGGRTTVGFESEPVIQQVAQSNGLQPGDVVVAINRKPITTEAGAAEFTNPPAGQSVVTVRRGREELQLSLEPRACRLVSSQLDLLLRDSALHRAGLKLHLDSGIHIRLDSLLHAHAKTGRLVFSNNISVSPKLKLVRDSLTKKLSFAFERLKDDLPELGIALQCEPSCTLVRNTDGKYYYKFDGYPRIGQIRALSSLPDGLRIGDRIISIDGVSITTEEGFMKVRKLRDGASHSLVVERDGQNITLSLKFR